MALRSQWRACHITLLQAEKKKKTLPERTFMLAAKQAGPISVASGRGSQPGSGVLPRPRLALLEAQAFKIQSACFTLTARNLRTDRNLLFKIC